MIKEKYSKRLGYKVDSNIEPLVHYLNKRGAKTLQSCGHGTPNRIILKNKKSLDKARIVFKELKLPKSAELQYTHKPKFTNRKYPMWNIVEFKRGNAHIIAKKLKMMGES